jgi:hypothetical protein
VLGGHDEIQGTPVPADVDAADDRDRDTVELAHHQLSGAGELVGGAESGLIVRLVE